MKNKWLIGLVTTASTICVVPPLATITSCQSTPEPTPEEDVSFEIEEKAKFASIFHIGETSHTFSFDLKRILNGDKVVVKVIDQKIAGTEEVASKVKIHGCESSTSEYSYTIKNDQTTFDLTIDPSSNDPFQDPFDVVFSLHISVIRDTKMVYDNTITGFEFAAIVTTTPDMFTTVGSKITGFDETKQEDINKCGCLIIPSDITEIGENAFKGKLDGFKYIILDEHQIDETKKSALKSIGSYAFAYNTTIKGELFIPANVEQIYSGAFDGCSSIEWLTFDEYSKLQKIYGSAFKNCISLKNSIEFPKTLKAISEGAFGTKDGGTKCEGLTSLTFNSIELELQNPQFWYQPNVNEINFPNIDNPSVQIKSLTYAFQNFNGNAVNINVKIGTADNWVNFIHESQEAGHFIPKKITCTIVEKY